MIVFFWSQYKSHKKPGTGKEFLSLDEKFQKVFQLQKHHRQTSTMLHIYIATKPLKIESHLTTTTRPWS